MLGKIIYSFSRNQKALNVLKDKYAINIPNLFRSNSGNEMLVQIFSALGWEGKLDSLFERGTSWGDIDDAFKTNKTPIVGNTQYMDEPVHFSKTKKLYYFVKKGLLTDDSINAISGLISELWAGMEIRKKGGEFYFCSDACPDGDTEVFIPPQVKTAKNAINKVYYGAPGTGKSFAINKETEGNEKVVTVFHLIHYTGFCWCA